MTFWTTQAGRRLGIVPAVLAAGALVFAGCGDDDDGGGGGGGSDEDYVASLCGALDQFAQDTNSLIEDADASADEEELFGDLADIIRDLSDELDSANPPDDLADANDELVSLLTEAADTVEEGDVNALDTVGEPDFELSDERQAELRAIAEDNETCVGLEEQGLGGLFDE